MQTPLRAKSTYSVNLRYLFWLLHSLYGAITGPNSLLFCERADRSRETRLRLFVSDVMNCPKKTNMAAVRETNKQPEGRRGGARRESGLTNLRLRSRWPAFLFHAVPSPYLVPVNSAFFRCLARIGNCFCAADRATIALACT